MRIPRHCTYFLVFPPSLRVALVLRQRDKHQTVPKTPTLQVRQEPHEYKFLFPQRRFIIPSTPHFRQKCVWIRRTMVGALLLSSPETAAKYIIGPAQLLVTSL